MYSQVYPKDALQPWVPINLVSEISDRQITD